MAEDPFDFIKIMMLLFLASIVAMSMPEVEANSHSAKLYKNPTSI
jgi:hypothetical protein